MKYVIVIYTVLMLLWAAHAKADMLISGLPCETIHYPGFAITKKLNATQYEAVSHHQQHSIVTLKKAKVTGVGAEQLVGVKLRRQGFKTMETEDGFSEDVQFYVECEK
jgi:hypothetical protein